MRKSTVWLAFLFIVCLSAWGWKHHIRPENVKEQAKAWAIELSMNQLRNFLNWRNPEAMLLAEQEERERLLEAEQQAYGILAENRGAGSDGNRSENLAKSDLTDGEYHDDHDSDDQTGAVSSNQTGKQSGTDSADSDYKNAANLPESNHDSDKAGAVRENADLQKSGEMRDNADSGGEQINDKQDGEAHIPDRSKAASNNKEQVTKDSNSDQPAKTQKNSIPFSELVQTAAGSKNSFYSWKQLTDFNFLTKNFYQINSSTTIYPSQLDGESYLKKNLAVDRDTKGPQILIYHTHGSEYFKDSDPKKPETLITGVGDELTRILEEKYGYQVYHDKTVFPYNSSYSMGREKVKELLEKYPDIQVIIDLHRDSSPDQHLAVDLNGKKTAQIMFFNGMSQTKDGPLESRKNENLKENLAFSLQLKLAAERLYPGFARKNFLKPYRYNMDLAGCYTLIECGAETNTLEEELNAMEPLAEILHCVLQ